MPGLLGAMTIALALGAARTEGRLPAILKTRISEGECSARVPTRGSTYFPAAKQMTTDVATASLFEIRYASTYKIVIGKLAEEQYVLTQCGQMKPTDNEVDLAAPLDGGYTRKYFTVPVRSAAAASTMQLAFLHSLGVQDRISYVPSSATAPCWQKAGPAPEGRRQRALGCGAALSTAWDSNSTRGAQRDVQLASVDAVFVDCNNRSCDTLHAQANAVHLPASQDHDPLKTAEYIKLVAAFFNKDPEAEMLFSATKAAYQGAFSRAPMNPPIVAWVASEAANPNYGPDQLVVSTASYKLKIVTDAGGANFNASAGLTEQALPGVQVADAVQGEPAAGKVYRIPLTASHGHPANASAALLDLLGNVDVLIDETHSVDPRLYTIDTFYSNFALANTSSLKFVQNRMVIRLDREIGRNNGLDWYESRLARPEWAVEGLARILHKDSSKRARFFRNIAAGEAVEVLTQGMCQRELPTCNSTVTPAVIPLLGAAAAGGTEVPALNLSLGMTVTGADYGALAANRTAWDGFVGAITGAVVSQGSSNGVAFPAASVAVSLGPGPNSSVFTVRVGGCSLGLDGCVSSPGYPGGYANQGICIIGVNTCTAGPLRVDHFSTEDEYDFLLVNGAHFSGARGPEGITAYGDIFWFSDSSLAAAGWKLCSGPRAPPAPAQASASELTGAAGGYQGGGDCAESPCSLRHHCSVIVSAVVSLPAEARQDTCDRWVQDSAAVFALKNAVSSALNDVSLGPAKIGRLGLKSFRFAGKGNVCLRNWILQGQEEVERLALAGCHDIAGGLQIRGTVWDLRPLKDVASVGGDVWIYRAPYLTSLVGLEGLASVRGDVRVYDSPNLTSLAGLGGLAHVSGSLGIYRNSNFASCAGLQSLASVGHQLEIYDNPSLASLVGLAGLVRVGGDVWIHDNPGLASLVGLEGLASVGGILGIYRNSGLVSLAGLVTLASVGNELQIYDNMNLASLTGLGSLVSVRAGVWIHMNPRLASLMGPKSLASVGGILMIYDNHNLASLTGLEGLAIVEADVWIYKNPNLTSLVGLEGLGGVGSDVWIYENPDLTSLGGLEGLVSVGGKLGIYGNSNLTSLSGLTSLATVGDELQIYNNANVASLMGLESLASVGGCVWIYENPKLALLEGMKGLESVGGDLMIYDNSNLASLVGLEGLVSVRGKLQIYENPNLTSLTGLEGLTSVGGHLWIFHNPNLATLKGLDGLVSLGADIQIIDNLKLTSLMGLQGLTSTESNIWINKNPTLTSLVGLEGLLNVGGDLAIWDNYNLGSLVGLDGLASVGNAVWISNNRNLTSLKGPKRLTSVSADLLIYRNPYLASLVGLESLVSVGELVIWDNPNLASLKGLEGLARVAGDLSIYRNANLAKLAELENLANVGNNLQIYENPNLASLTGLNGLVSVGEDLSIHDNPKLTSLVGLEVLATVGMDLLIHGNLNLALLTGIEGLTSVGNDLRIYNNPSLASLAGFEGLVSVGGHVWIHDHPSLAFLGGLEGLASIRDLRIRANPRLTSLVGLGGLVSVRGLFLHDNLALASLTGLRGLQEVWGDIRITNSPKLHSLDGLGGVRQAGMVEVMESGLPLAALGGPFANGATVRSIRIDNASWPRCVAPQELEVLNAAVRERDLTSMPSATWEGWHSRSCGGPGVVQCVRGRACRFSLGGADITGLKRVFLSGIRGGCGACSKDRPQADISFHAMVDFADALQDENAGVHSICRCDTRVGPVAQLALQGPSLHSPRVMCVSGSTCRFTLRGEGLRLEDCVVVTRSTTCAEGLSSSYPVRRSLASDEYYLEHQTGWSDAPPTIYSVCWRAAAMTAAESSGCSMPGDAAYLKATELDLVGPFRRHYPPIILGNDLSIPSIGFLVPGNARMRLLPTCKQTRQDSSRGVIEANSSQMMFNFGRLTADRLRAGPYKLCWCQWQGEGNCTENWHFAADAGDVLIVCPRGQEASAGRCHQCPPGRFQHRQRERCKACPPGRFSPGGSMQCQLCPMHASAATAGSSACSTCTAVRSPDADRAACIVDPAKVALLAVHLLCCSLPCAMLVLVIQRQYRVVDVSFNEGKTIVTMQRPHGLLPRRGKRTFPVTLCGTQHPDLDSHLQSFRAGVFDALRLELLTVTGRSINKRLDTSMGWITVPTSHCLWHSGWPVPVAVTIPLLALAALAMGTLELAVDVGMNGLEVVASALAVAAAALVSRLWDHPTPLDVRLAQFEKRLKRQFPEPRGCARGPGRAVPLGRLHELLEFFRHFIRNRTAYYLDSNILQPLTKARELSYAELVGPRDVEWFVSHFWGTPFAHFCTSLQKHAETVCGGRNWREVCYWVCFVSNNQYRIKQELGSTWEESSFYITLKSGLCKGTCMVLDDQALPLTRIWCIFELLQTVRLERNNNSFGGLLLCTSSGLLNSGNASIEVSLALSEKVANMDLRRAKSSDPRDGNMIRAQVRRELGSFSVLNYYVRAAVRDLFEAAMRRSSEHFQDVCDLLQQCCEASHRAATQELADSPAPEAAFETPQPRVAGEEPAAIVIVRECSA